MELHQVRYFLALAKSLNFTRAAEQCNVTQPALTKAVQKLEHEFGGELIHRERQLTQLTELGKVVLPMLERTLAAADSARAQAKNYRNKEVAPLRVGLSPSVSSTLLVEPLAELGKFLPGLQVELTETPAGDLVEELLQGHVTAALTGELETLPARIDGWVLFRERYVLIASSRHAIAARDEVEASELDAMTWLDRHDCHMGERLKTAIARRGWALDHRHSGRRAPHVQTMAAAGLGVAIAPEHVPRLPGLVTRPVRDVDLTRDVKLLAVAGRRRSPALDALIKIARLRNWASDLRRESGSEADAAHSTPSG